jgi:hypothetical protein
MLPLEAGKYEDEEEIFRFEHSAHWRETPLEPHLELEQDDIFTFERNPHHAHTHPLASCPHEEEGG